MSKEQQGAPKRQLAFKFRLKIKDQLDELSRNVKDLKISYLDKTMTLNVYQPVTGDIHSYILSMCYRVFDVMVEHLDDNIDPPTHTTKYTNCKVVDHAYHLSYADTGRAVHQLTIKFNDMVLT